MKYIAYYRVSTNRQGTSGLGLEAQEYAVQSFLKTDDCLLCSFTEIESGKKNTRPELGKAISAAKQANAMLVIAKLDRLSRNAAFILSLRDAGCPFVCADMPEANSFTIGIFAILAQHEAELISSRTKLALQASKVRGKKLGTPKNLTSEARKKGLVIRKENAVSNKNNVQATEIIKLYREKGISFRSIAENLNTAGYSTRNGKQFYAATVKMLFDRSLK